jgi:dipeptidyl aminopeptidase/acylaminoacyl peptidase
MTRSQIIFIAAITALLLTSILAIPGICENESAQKPLSVDDVVDLESAGSFNISPNEDWIAWIKTISDKGKNMKVGNLFLTSLADTVTLQLTRGKDGAGSPQFSPDGSKLAYVSSIGKGKAQVYLYDIRGGSPEKLTSVTQGVRKYRWRSDNEILFTAAEDSTLRERKLKKDKDDVIVVADQEHYGPVRLYSISLGKKKVRRLTNNTGIITQHAVSPCGRWVVMSENINVDYQYDHRIRPMQKILDLETGEISELFTEPYLDPSQFEWTHDGKGFYCRRSFASDSTDDYVSISHLWYYDMKSQSLRPLTKFWKRGLGMGGWHVTDDGVLVTLARGSKNRIVFIKIKGKGFSRKFVESPSSLQIRTLAGRPGSKRIAYMIADASTVPLIMTAELNNGKLRGERELVKLNAAAKSRILVQSEIVKWAGARGDEVEGILYYPRGYDRSRSYPLMVSLHGGPAGADLDFFSERWSNYPHLLAGRGIAVLKVNYHGSGNFGLEWVESVKGRYYEYEVPDILSGVDMVVEKGIAHPDSLGIMGWSNGSILAIAACLETDRFKVLCAGAGDVNWISDYGNCAFGAGFDNAYFGGPPWENVDLYIEKSPLFRIHTMKTPTLIMFGTKDRNVPTEQGWQHFRAMQQSGAAPVKFILFPGAGHGPVMLSHRKRKMNEELAWIDFYLLGKAKEINEAFEEDSPLAYELKKAGAARSGRLLGEMIDGILVPETAEIAGMHAGRFEVTRAQYAAFDESYVIPEGTENWPASGIAFEKASKYCKWLSEKTGRQYRLPSEDEMEKCISIAEGNASRENNLDWWAGYTLTPDEVPGVMVKVGKLEERSLLLKECGSFPPAGESGIWDLAGNVAEWTVTEDNSGKVLGLSALNPRDKRCKYTPPPLRYTGFRVVEDK